MNRGAGTTGERELTPLPRSRSSELEVGGIRLQREESKEHKRDTEQVKLDEQEAV